MNASPFMWPTALANGLPAIVSSLAAQTDLLAFCRERLGVGTRHKHIHMTEAGSANAFVVVSGFGRS